MGQVIKAYLGVVFLLLMGLVGIGIVAAGMEVNAARNYHADVIAEIECSNFHPAVIDACKSQAQEAGYCLEVEKLAYDAEGKEQTAEVVLSFDYAIPILNLVSDHKVRGFAR